jgi:hypothetical protein
LCKHQIFVFCTCFIYITKLGFSMPDNPCSSCTNLSNPTPKKISQIYYTVIKMNLSFKPLSIIPLKLHPFDTTSQHLLHNHHMGTLRKWIIHGTLLEIIMYSGQIYLLLRNYLEIFIIIQLHWTTQTQDGKQHKSHSWHTLHCHWMTLLQLYNILTINLQLDMLK